MVLLNLYKSFIRSKLRLRMYHLRYNS